MDYSKWKKILVILMIINLSFVIFSKITKSFGAIDSNNATINVTGGTITLPTSLFPSNNTYNYFLFQNPTSTDGVYNWALFFTRGNSNLIKNNNYSINNYQGPAFLSTGASSFAGLNSGWAGNYFYSIFTGTIQEFQTRLDNWNTNDSLGSGWYSYFLIDNTGYNINSLDYDNSYIYSSSDILDENGDTLIPAGSYTPPSLQNKPHFDNPDTELQSLNFDKIFISMGSYTTDDPLYLKVLEVTKVDEDINDSSNNVYYYNDLTFTLTNNKNFLHEYFDSGTYYYSIPYSALKLKKDKSYYFILTNSSDKITQTQGEIVENDIYFDVCLCDTTNIVTTQEEIMNSIINNTPSDDTNNIINNNLPRPNYSDNNIDIPGMNVDIPGDITTDGFNYIFNAIYSQINPSNNTDPAQDIVINIPFVNQELRINKNFTRNLIGYDSPIITLLSAFYYFIISYYIVHDIRNTIEKVKTGDIMTHTDTNIKADML